MADEASVEAPPPEGRRATDRKRAQAAAAPVDATATEKPVKAGVAPPTTKYIVTVDNVTGLPLKIEKLTEEKDKQEGKPASTSATPAAMTTTTVAAPAPDPTAIVQAYYKGIADYLNAIKSVT